MAEFPPSLDLPKIDLSEIEALLRDPFTDLTRKQKRNLMVSSVAAITMVLFKIQPTAIPAIGISKLPENSESIVLGLMFLACSYFAGTFVFYAGLDLVRKVAIFNHYRHLAFLSGESNHIEKRMRENKINKKGNVESKKQNGYLEEEEINEYAQIMDRYEGVWRFAQEIMMKSYRRRLIIDIARVVVDFFFPTAVGLIAIYMTAEHGMTLLGW